MARVDSHRSAAARGRSRRDDGRPVQDRRSLAEPGKPSDEASEPPFSAEGAPAVCRDVAPSLGGAAPCHTAPESHRDAPSDIEIDPWGLAGPPPPKKAGGRKAPPEKPAGQRYAEAYAQGQTDASGQPFAVPTATKAFWPILRAHAVDAYGSPITGDALLEWIRKSSAEYRRACEKSAAYQRGFSVPRWGEWHQAGRPSSGAGRFGQGAQAAPSRAWR